MATRQATRKQGGTGTRKVSTPSKKSAGGAAKKTRSGASQPGAAKSRSAAKTGGEAGKRGGAKRSAARTVEPSGSEQTTFFWLFGFAREKLGEDILNVIRKAGVPIKVSRRRRRGQFSEVALIDAKDEDIQDLAFLVSDPFYDESKAAEFVQEGQAGFRIWEACSNCVLVSVGPG